MNQDKLRLQAGGLVAGFGLQFLIGMTLNLFVKLPATHPGTSGGNFFARSSHSFVWALSGGGGPALAIHAYIALGLFLGCFGLFVRGLRENKRIWSWTGGIAALFTLGALFNGLSFVDYSEDANSMVMATLWLAAVSALVIGLARTAPGQSNKKLGEPRETHG